MGNNRWMLSVRGVLACGILIAASAADNAVTAAPWSRQDAAPVSERANVTPVQGPAVASEYSSAVEESAAQGGSETPREPADQLLSAVEGDHRWQQLAQEVNRMQPVAVEDLASAVASVTQGPQVAAVAFDAEQEDTHEVEEDPEAQEYTEEEAQEDAEAEEGPTAGEVEVEQEEEEENEEHHDYFQHVFIGVAYDLPVQLRPREGGSDPGYLQLMLDEKAFNDLMNRSVNAEDPEAAAQNQSAETQKKPQANGVFSVCYIKDLKELEVRFQRAVELGEGVYVPMQQMTDFSRHKDFSRGNPGVQDVQLPNDHYASAISDWDAAFFDAVREQKQKTQLKVGGIWFGPPNYEKIDSLLKQNPELFDGVYFDWEDGQGACMNNLGKPPKANAEGVKTYWADKPDFFFRYYMGGQDGDVCKLPDGQSYIRDVPVNVGRDLTLPDGVSPVFPCYGGNEGLCYKAFSKFIEAACDSKLQRYSFAIYDRYSDRMRLMLEEGCKNLGVPVPAMDFIGAL